MTDRPAPIYTVDRLEGDIAVLLGDDGKTYDVARRELPKGAREGSVLRAPAGPKGAPDWSRAVLDEAERLRRLKETREQLDKLRKGSPKGDISL